MTKYVVVLFEIDAEEYSSSIVPETYSEEAIVREGLAGETDLPTPKLIKAYELTELPQL